MNCMRCGREIPLGQAFCKECLEDMERYPVKPDAPVQLPPPPPPVHNKARSAHPRKSKKPEEQIAALRKVIRIQSLVLALILLLFGASLFYFSKKLEQKKTYLPGQNYHSVTESTEY